MTRIPAVAAILLVTAVSLTACVPSSPTPSPVPPELAWTLEQSTPTTVTPTADDTHAATAFIPVSGGELSATAADGTTYTLTVPPDALRVGTQIALTPVTSVADSPFDQTASYGVQIEPDGMQLDAFATLEIVPATPVPGDQQLLYQYEGAGDNLRFATPTPAASGISISTDHFSGYGTAATAPNKVQEEYRLGGDAAAAIESELDRRIQLQSQPRADGSRPPINLDDLQPFFDLYRDYVVEPRLTHATDSCAAGLVAIDTYNHFEKKLALLGAEPQPSERWSGILKTVAATCMDQEYTYCTTEHLVYRILPLYVSLVRMLAQAGIEDGEVIDDLKTKVVGCLSFRLDFESDAVLEGSSGWESAVEGSVDLEFDPSATDPATGGWKPQFRPASGTLTNTSVSAQQEGWSGCTATATPTDGELQVQGMDILASGFDALAVDTGQQRVGQLDDIRLLFTATLSGGELQITCPSPTFQVPRIPGMWFSAFMTSHQNEIDQSPTSGGVRFAQWEPGTTGDPVIARRSWNATGDSAHESGTFTLTHTPH